MRDEGDMIAAPAGSLTCLELCAALGTVMVMIYVLLTMALVLLA
jgi:hypothetical protein